MRLSSAVLMLLLTSPMMALAQSPESAQSISVPRLISVGGVFRPADGRRPDAVETVTLAIYAEERDGVPVWQETQNVAVDDRGRYALLLGSTHSDGIPLAVFRSGEAHWLGTRFERSGEVEGPRVRIASVPYALRASDADTLGGLPASAYLRTASSATSGIRDTTAAATDPPAVPPTLQTSDIVLDGTPNFLAKYVNGSDVDDSAVYEASGRVGLGTTSPVDMLHLRFTHTAGALTGLAVQNLGNTTTSYSGMLFYDHTGALGQFQGFNNVTHEYRINNIATSSGLFDGSINFMIGSTSRFFVASNGNIGIGTQSPGGSLDVVRDGASSVLATSFGTVAGGFMSRFARGTASAPTAVQTLDVIGTIGATGYGATGFATSPRAGMLAVAAEDWTDTAQGTALVLGTTPIGATEAEGYVAILSSGNVGIGTPEGPSGEPTALDRLHVFGDIRVGTGGTNGCLKDFGGNPLTGTCSSDRRFKRDIVPFGRSLDRVAALQPVHYFWRAGDFPDRHFGDRKGYGLIAQDVEEVLPELVVTGDDGYKSVDYSKLPLLAIQAVKDLKDENESLKQRISALERLVTESLAAARR
jgi:hypothetical protein